MKPLVIIGLGNPGDKYEKTRHNVGFMFVDFLTQQLDTSTFKKSKIGNVHISQGNYAGKKIILAKPQDFMNSSGSATQALVQFYKITPQTDLIIVHDDLDIDSGHFKVSKDRGAAGQNGVIDIISKIQTKDFTRYRIGIESRDQQQRLNIKGSDFVLGRFTKQQQDDINDTFNHLTTEIKKHIELWGQEKTSQI